MRLCGSLRRLQNLGMCCGRICQSVLRKLLLYKIGFFVATSLLTLFFALTVAAVQGIAKFEKLKKWFPPAIAIQLIPGLKSIVTKYIPSVILNGFIYVVPFSFLGMAHMAGYFTQSEMEIKVCHMVFYFLVGNVFLLSLLSGSLLDELGESISHPRNIPSHLARAVAAQADFFMTYILTDGLSGFSLEILQAGLLVWNLRNIEDVYCTSYETCRQYWPYIHHWILFAIVFLQITMMGLFGLKRKPEASIATIPLLILPLLSNEYPSFSFFLPFNTIQSRTPKKRMI